ncbi:hypothetical protein [Micromonospora thermarum]|uniref:Secreted protein n=1 Tax=Micromonospora thermarum TaxID=2720024 RepID=A0ABX0Z2X3_9ACTN|nr:hypothetical protein [Micromonospora thermarum]NJP31828.1 hypothetical protein [Micromonospora thermarum]
MSKRFATRLAGAVALGSAALLLGTPAAAFADHGKGSDRDGGVTCGTVEQSNRAFVANIISDNEVEDSDVAVEQNVSIDQRNENRTQPNTVIVCINDVELELELD